MHSPHPLQPRLCGQFTYQDPPPPFKTAGSALGKQVDSRHADRLALAQERGQNPHSYSGSMSLAGGGGGVVG